jgi:hypothetical protein
MVLLLIYKGTSCVLFEFSEWQIHNQEYPVNMLVILFGAA